MAPDCANVPGVRITGWAPGFKKIEHTKQLRECAGMSLVEAKAATDAVLENMTVVISLPDAAAARALAAQLLELGAQAQAIE